MPYHSNTTRRLIVCASMIGGGIVALGVPSTPVAAQRAQHATGDDILVTARRSAPPAFPPVVVDRTLNVIGLPGAKEDGSGRLSITERTVTFVTDKSTGAIPISAVRSVSIEHTSKPLLRGIAGTLAAFAPNGGGQVYSIIRPGAEMLTLYYVDEDDAVHAAVMLIPQSRKAALADAFERVGITPDQPTRWPEAVTVGSPRGRMARRVTTSGDGRPSVMIILPDRGAVPVPVAFTASVYEQLVAQSARSGLFGAVWREGDRRAGPGTLTMAVRITGFKKGSAGVRGAIPVVGMIAGKTLMTANVSLTDADGRVLIDREVKGSKRMMGESIAATRSLAQRVTGSITRIPGFAKGPPANSRYSPDEVAAR